jgi:hypothetical protein
MHLRTYQQFSPLALLILLCTSLVAGGQSPEVTNAKPPRSVTGHYVMSRAAFHNRLDVEQLPGGKIKFDLVALWVSHDNPDNVHNGEIQAIVSLEKGVAVYQEGGCRIKMEFLANKVRISESDEVGDCGFGVNVTAAGSYRKTDTKKPKFDF